MCFDLVLKIPPKKYQLKQRKQNTAQIVILCMLNEQSREFRERKGGREGHE